MADIPPIEVGNDLCLTRQTLTLQRLIIIIIIIAFKGAIRDFFYNLLPALRTAFNMYAQVMQAQSCTNHVQYIECLSHATCRVTCHVVRRDSSAIKFNRVEIVFILAFLLLAEPLTDEGGEETEYPEKTPGDELQKIPPTKAQRFKPRSETRTHTTALVAG